MVLAINDLVSLLGKVIHVELKADYAESLYIGYFKVKGIKRDPIHEDIIISGTDEEGMDRDIPIKWVADWYLVH
jgi:hypothetical protein